MDFTSLTDPTLYLPWAVGGGKAIATIVLGYIVAGWAQGLANSGLERAKVDVALARFIGQIVRYTIIFATFIAAAEAVGFETTSLMAIFASAGLAVGLALQGSLSNFAAGVMILFFRPFTIGDVITGGGLTGQVAEIGLFATIMMKPDGTKVIVPNGGLTGGTIENHTELGGRRGTVDIGVDYSVNLDDVYAALNKAAESVPEIVRAEGKGHAVYFASFGGSSLDFVVHAWATPADYLTMLEKLRVAIYNELNAAGIGIPFPQLDVHLDGNLGN
jgi:small conductance mechanosensitive channel